MLKCAITGRTGLLLLGSVSLSRHLSIMCSKSTRKQSGDRNGRRGSVCNWSPVIDSALERLNGACYYRCALQASPFEYLQRRDKKEELLDVDSYNIAVRSFQPNWMVLYQHLTLHRKISVLGLKAFVLNGIIDVKAWRSLDP